MIKKIAKIKEHIIFQDFKWKSELPEFNKKNVIYGWNGSGKTTLANLFRAIELKRNITDGEVEFVLDDRTIKGKDLGEELNLPNIKVFNKNFVDDTVFSSSGSIAPIHYVAEGGRIKREKIEELEKEKDKIQGQSQDILTKINENDRQRSSLLIDTAKSIKKILRSPGANIYNDYNKRDFENKLIELQETSEENLMNKILSDADFDQMKEKIQARPKEKIPEFNSPFPDTKSLMINVKELLSQTVVANVLEELENDNELSSWIRTGLSIHIKRESKKCLFCKNEISHSRKVDLEEHFNDSYTNFIKKLDQTSRQLNSIIQEIEDYTLFPKTNLYDHLYSRYNDIREAFKDEKKKVIGFLKSLISELESKKGKPFKEISLSISPVDLDPQLTTSIEKIILDHNSETEDFERAIGEARLKIEECIATEKVEEYTILNEEKSKLLRQHEAKKNNIKTIDEQVDKLNSEISEHKRPADELNQDLESYLGRKELEFIAHDSGYRIKRNGEDAKNLSEGERTAIAFLYFLKSINDENFKSNKRIVVIDDPISSLDSNSIFHAFGFMRTRTEDINQLFILTHNHAFFRQVKNWFAHWDRQKKYLNKEKKPYRFYMLNVIQKESERTSVIEQMDKLLYKYESEYHYLFSIIKKRSDRSKVEDLETFYHYPNIARRLLEAFLAFKKPTLSYSLHKALNSIEFDTAKKNQIIRFVHTNSHSDLISEPEHDLSILGETPTVLKHIMELFETVDKDHYEEMTKCVA